MANAVASPHSILPLLQCLKSIDNHLCADCSSPLLNPTTYASLAFRIWLCKECADTHTLVLGKDVSQIKRLLSAEGNINVPDSHGWSKTDISRMLSAVSNSVQNGILMRYIPKNFRVLTPQASFEERKSFIRAKYESKMFQFPNYDTIDQFGLFGFDFSASRNDTLGKGERDSVIRENSNIRGSVFNIRESVNSSSVSAFAPTTPPSIAPLSKKELKDAAIRSLKTLPPRLFEYFAVIRAGSPLSSISTESSLENIRFKPQVVSCLPVTPHKEGPLPELIASLAFPSGITLCDVEKPPTSFSSVLTNANRQKLYCYTLTVWELLDAETPLQSLTFNLQNSIVYSPTALCIVSFYPLFHLFREVVCSVYHTSLSLSPIPLERYIGHLLFSVPLPPQGCDSVLLALPSNEHFITRISLPPPNRLPPVDISYRPLFLCLSIQNIITAIRLLSLERSVCLLSQNMTLLTPVAETLLSLLFPMAWVGCYIPVLPLAMIDILDAPVPLLVGTLSPCPLRPPNIYFINLDTNTISLGSETVSLNSFSSPSHPSYVPSPSKHYMDKLANKLAECSQQSAYWKSQLSSIHLPFPTSSHLHPLSLRQSASNRESVDNKIEKAFMRKSTTSVSSGGLIAGMNNGVHTNAGVSSATSKGKGITIVHGFNFQRGLQRCTSKMRKTVAATTSSTSTHVPPSLLDPSSNEPIFIEEWLANCKLQASTSHENPYASILDTFDASEIRMAFLRFWASLLLDYEDYIVEQNSPSLSLASSDVLSRTSLHTSPPPCPPTSSTSSPDIMPRLQTKENSEGKESKDSGRLSRFIRNSLALGHMTHSSQGGQSHRTNDQDTCRDSISQSNATKVPLSSPVAPRFDMDRFIVEKGEDSFLGVLARTQMFESFIFDLLDEPRQRDLVLFQEVVNLKKGKKVVNKFSKTTTPFLNETCWDLRGDNEGVWAGEPSDLGIPEGSVFSYSTHFPVLSSALIGNPTPAPILQSPSDLSCLGRRVVLASATPYSILGDRLSRFAFSSSTSSNENTLHTSMSDASPTSSPPYDEVYRSSLVTDLIDVAKARAIKLNLIITCIQSRWRMRPIRKAYCLLLSRRRLQRLLKSCISRYIIRRRHQKRRRAAVCIQSHYRAMKCRRIFLIRLRSAHLIKAFVLGRFIRKKCNSLRVSLFNSYRSQLLKLWWAMSEPLGWRAVFWSHVCMLTTGTQSAQSQFNSPIVPNTLVPSSAGHSINYSQQSDSRPSFPSKRLSIYSWIFPSRLSAPFMSQTKPTSLCIPTQQTTIATTVSYFTLALLRGELLRLYQQLGFYSSSPSPSFSSSSASTFTNSSAPTSTSLRLLLSRESPFDEQFAKVECSAFLNNIASISTIPSALRQYIISGDARNYEASSEIPSSSSTPPVAISPSNLTSEIKNPISVPTFPLDSILRTVATSHRASVRTANINLNNERQALYMTFKRLVKSKKFQLDSLFASLNITPLLRRKETSSLLLFCSTDVELCNLCACLICDVDKEDLFSSLTSPHIHTLQTLIDSRRRSALIAFVSTALKKGAQEKMKCKSPLKKTGV